MSKIFSIARIYLKNIDIKHIRMSFVSGGQPLEVNNEFINILAEDKKTAIETIEKNIHDPHIIRWAQSYISSLESCASNDIFENQLSKILGIRLSLIHI